MQGREDRGALDATGVASFICVTDVQFGSPRGGDRTDSGPLEHENHRGGLPARTAAGPDDRRRGHGQAFRPPCVLTFVGRSSEPMATQRLIHVTTSTQYRRHYRDQREDRRPRLWPTPDRAFWFLAASPPAMRHVSGSWQRRPEFAAQSLTNPRFRVAHVPDSAQTIQSRIALSRLPLARSDPLGLNATDWTSAV